MATHTKGPWTVREQGEANQYYIMAGDKWLFAFLHNGEAWTSEQMANARLIAAAPAMLAALRDAEKLISGWMDSGPTINAIRAAISAAEGH